MNATLLLLCFKRSFDILVQGTGQCSGFEHSVGRRANAGNVFLVPDSWDFKLYSFYKLLQLFITLHELELIVPALNCYFRIYSSVLFLSTNHLPSYALCESFRSPRHNVTIQIQFGSNALSESASIDDAGPSTYPIFLVVVNQTD